MGLKVKGGALVAHNKQGRWALTEDEELCDCSCGCDEVVTNCTFLYNTCVDFGDSVSILYFGAKDTNTGRMYDFDPNAQIPSSCVEVWPVIELEFDGCQENPGGGAIIKLWYIGGWTLYLTEPGSTCEPVDVLEILDGGSVRLMPGCKWEVEIIARRLSLDLGTVLQNLVAVIPVSGYPCPDYPAVFGPVRFYDSDTNTQTHIECKVGYLASPY